MINVIHHIEIETNSDNTQKAFMSTLLFKSITILLSRGKFKNLKHQLFTQLCSTVRIWLANFSQ